MTSSERKLQTHTCYLGDAFEVLAVGVGVDLEVRLKDLQLLLGERGAHALVL